MVGGEIRIFLHLPSWSLSGCDCGAGGMVKDGSWEKCFDNVKNDNYEMLKTVFWHYEYSYFSLSFQALWNDG